MPEQQTPPDVAIAQIRSESEKKALQLINEYGPQFAEKFPNIVEDVRNGLTIKEIAKKYKVCEMFGVTDAIARSIVAFATRKHVSPEERDFIYSPARVDRAHKNALTTMRNKTGLFGMTQEQRHSAGVAAGNKSKELGRGIFAMTSKQLSEASRKGSEKPKSNSWFFGEKINGMLEGEFANFLASLPEYQLNTGYYKGSPDYTKIADAVNVVYGRNRSRSSTKGFFENEKVRAKRKPRLQEE